MRLIKALAVGRERTEEEKARGVIACSAGNHAQGVALAATKYGIKSIICLPDGAPISKVEATKAYGAQVELVGALGQLGDAGIVESIEGRGDGLHAETLQIVIIGLEGGFEDGALRLLPVLPAS